MKPIKLYLIVGMIYVCSLLVCCGISSIRTPLDSFYTSDALRTPLFTGLLTMGAFLLSAKTFIIFNLKRDLYDTPAYVTLVATRTLQGKVDHYRGLRQLSDFLSISIYGALLGALFNLILGTLNCAWTHVFALTWSVATIIAVLAAWTLVWRNIHDWLTNLTPPGAS
jgi:hypothetical protein